MIGVDVSLVIEQIQLTTVVPEMMNHLFSNKNLKTAAHVTGKTVMSEEIEKLAGIENLAGKMYDGYCDAVGGVAFNGDPLPKWSEFGSDPAKQKQANGWRKAAEIAFAKFNNTDSTFLERLVLEELELGKKIGGLNNALNAPGFAEKVGDLQFELLSIQHSNMVAYRRVLRMRLHDLTKENSQPQA